MYFLLSHTDNQKMDKYELRKRRLQILVDQAGGPSQFAKKFSRANADKPIDETYVSQILNSHRKFGEKAARNMERRAGLPPEFFDQEDDETAVTISEKDLGYVTNLERYKRELKPLTQKVVEMMEAMDDETRGAVYGAALMLVKALPREAQERILKAG